MKTICLRLQVVRPEEEILPRDVTTVFYGIRDLWHDAQMVEVLQYLYGNTNLELPEDWEDYFPKAG